MVLWLEFIHYAVIYRDHNEIVFRGEATLIRNEIFQNFYEEIMNQKISSITMSSRYSVGISFKGLKPALNRTICF